MQASASANVCLLAVHGKKRSAPTGARGPRGNAPRLPPKYATGRRCRGFGSNGAWNAFATEGQGVRRKSGSALMVSHSTNRTETPSFPTSAGIFFGLGLGGFFDGIVLHQMLQWHHMLSSWYPIKDVPSLELNTLWDGIFHSSTYVVVVLGLFILWRTAHTRHLLWSNKLLFGTLLLGWGAFNVAEGIIDHEILGVHHVNELVTQSQRIYWDIGFLVWGAATFIIGWVLLKAGQRETVTPR
jgi:uncharacterized membrane protein